MLKNEQFPYTVPTLHDANEPPNSFSFFKEKVAASGGGRFFAEDGTGSPLDDGKGYINIIHCEKLFEPYSEIIKSLKLLITHERFLLTSISAILKIFNPKDFK